MDGQTKQRIVTHPIGFERRKLSRRESVGQDHRGDAVRSPQRQERRSDRRVLTLNRAACFTPRVFFSAEDETMVPPVWTPSLESAAELRGEAHALRFFVSARPRPFRRRRKSTREKNHFWQISTRSRNLLALLYFFIFNILRETWNFIALSNFEWFFSFRLDFTPPGLSF